MVNQAIWIGLVIGVFFAGLGIGYAVFPSSAPVSPMMMTSQQMQQMMNDPNQMTQWHQTMMNDPQVMDRWMDTIMTDPKTRQHMFIKINQEMTEEFQEMDELTSLLEKPDLRGKLLKQMETHNQNLASLVPFYTDDPKVNEMMTEKMIEHNYLMNQLLSQETIESELEDSIKKHIEEHQEIAELIASLNQNG
jgi:hypothetical protein